MKKGSKLKLAKIILALYFALLVVAVIDNADVWLSLLILIAPALAGVVLLLSYFRSSAHWKPQLVFGVAAIVWFIYKLPMALAMAGLVASDWVSLMDDIALIPNLMLALCAGLLLLSFRKILQTIQIVFDILSSGLLSLLLIWVFFKQEILEVIDTANRQAIMAVLAGLFDYIALVSVVLLLTTVRGTLKTHLVRVMSESIILFAVADISHLVLRHLYPAVDHSFVDALYALSYLFLAVAGFNCLAEPAWRPEIQEAANRQKSSTDKYIRMLFFVLAVAVFLIFGTNLKTTDILLLLGLGLFYQIVNGLIQNGLKNQKILQLQREMNIRLEQSVVERTEQLRISNKQLQRISIHDDVTGLYNRRHFHKEIDLMLRLNKPDDMVVVFFIDLDRFKGVNDTHGHDVGDKVLMIVAERLTKLKRPHAVLARLGGDEFVLAIRDQLSSDDIAELAGQLVECCRLPVVIEPFHFHLTMSVGIAVYPNDATQSVMLMKYADIAMYQAKERGSNQYAFFSQEQKSKVQRRAKIEMLLKNADFDQEFEMVYQPQFSLPDRRLIGAEALFRWNNPQEGMIMPGESIPIAEDNGMIIPIGLWIIRQVIRQAIRWNDELGLDLKLALNVSPRQLDQADFQKELQMLMHEVAIHPGWLDFEITESIALNEDEKIGEILKQISQMGITLSVDDFGTGYSSLSYLKKYPINRIKIARQLVESSVGNEQNTSILKAIIVMSKALDMTAIAEGVEDENQLALLNTLKCDEVQGYLTGRPVRVAEFEERFIKSARAAAEKTRPASSVDQSEG